ncbi:MAG: acetoin utilization protein AcuC [Actinomycetota bacterium]
MSGDVSLVVCREARIYDHGPQHPLRPERVLLTWDLIEALELDRAPHVSVRRCEPATDKEIQLVHTPAYIEATKDAEDLRRPDLIPFGFGPGDNPIFPRMHEAAALVVGASLSGARAIAGGDALHAFNAAGGLHHAMPSRASGFCVYDDPAIAIAWLLRNGFSRIAYVDVDVHHGDGPQAIFWNDPRVLTISLHESGEFLFPGTGSSDERGGGDAVGTKVNVPLAPGTSDVGWLRAFNVVVPPLVRAFRPDVVVSQLGCDTHVSDPLAHLRLTTRAYREVGSTLHGLAHEAAGGRWLGTGGGGYQWARVTPRAWTIAFAAMMEADLPDQLPAAWVERASSLAGEPVPDSFSEPAEEPGSADESAEAIAQTALAGAGAS